LMGKNLMDSIVRVLKDFKLNKEIRMLGIILVPA